MGNRLQPSLDSGKRDVPGKTAVRGSLTLRDYDGQVAEAMAYGTSAEQNDESRYAMKACVLPENTTRYGETAKSDLFNKANHV